MKHRLGLVLLITMLLSACAATGGKGDRDHRLAAVGNTHPERAIVYVEGAGNFVTNKVMVGSLKSGTRSSQSQSILKLLQLKNPALAVVVTGADDGLSAATLERAMINGQGQIAGSKVVFVGSLQYKEALTQLASTSGVQFEFIAYPQ